MVLITRFEVEHGFQQALFGSNTDPKVVEALARAGLGPDFRGNLIGSYSEPKTVDAIQNADSRIQDSIRDNGFGTLRHDSRDPPAGFQKEKLEFQRIEMERIIVAAMGDLALEKKMILNFHQWTMEKFLPGLVKNNGTPLGIIGESIDDYRAAWNADSFYVMDSEDFARKNVNGELDKRISDYDASLDRTVLKGSAAYRRDFAETFIDGITDPSIKGAALDALNGGGTPAVKVRNAHVIATTAQLESELIIAHGQRAVQVELVTAIESAAKGDDKAGTWDDRYNQIDLLGNDALNEIVSRFKAGTTNTPTLDAVGQLLNFFDSLGDAIGQTKTEFLNEAPGSISKFVANSDKFLNVELDQWPGISREVFAEVSARADAGPVFDVMAAAGRKDGKSAVDMLNDHQDRIQFIDPNDAKIHGVDAANLTKMTVANFLKFSDQAIANATPGETGPSTGKTWALNATELAKAVDPDPQKIAEFLNANIDLLAFVGNGETPTFHGVDISKLDGISEGKLRQISAEALNNVGPDEVGPDKGKAYLEARQANAEALSGDPDSNGTDVLNLDGLSDIVQRILATSGAVSHAALSVAVEIARIGNEKLTALLNGIKSYGAKLESVFESNLTERPLVRWPIRSTRCWLGWVAMHSVTRLSF